MEAMAKAPSVSAGRTRCSQPPRPEVGNQFALSENSRMNRMPRKNVGADWPTRATPIVMWSIGELRLTAESRPMGTATTRARPKAASASSAVAGTETLHTRQAGWRKWMERPKSPRRTLPRNTASCTGRGRSRPRSLPRRSYSLRGAPGGTSNGTGSPDRRMTTKTTVETSQRATSARNSRGPRNPTSARMMGPGPWGPGRCTISRPLQLEVEAPELDLLVGVRRELDVLLQPVILVGLDDDDPRPVLHEDLRHLLVGLAAELLVDRETRRLAQLVALGGAPV